MPDITFYQACLHTIHRILGRIKVVSDITRHAAKVMPS